MSGGLKLESFLTDPRSPRAGTSAAVEVAAKSGADADAYVQCCAVRFGPCSAIDGDQAAQQL